jgi:RES domain-containing protein
MKVYRITPASFADLSGAGSRKFPGRWNTEGVSCIYTSASASLALLEIMVNVEDWTVFERVRHILLTIDVSESQLVAIRTDELPKNWNSSAVTEETQQFGARHLMDPDTLGIIIPSVVVRTESNVILNPQARNFDGLVRIIATSEFTLDHRLLK